MGTHFGKVIMQAEEVGSLRPHHMLDCVLIADVISLSDQRCHFIQVFFVCHGGSGSEQAVILAQICEGNTSLAPGRTAVTHNRRYCPHLPTSPLSCPG
jgi:hypothetical protein